MTDSLYTALRRALSRKPEELTFSDNSYYNEDFMESSIRTEFSGWYDQDTVEEQVGFILDHCQLQEGATALDVACGHGHHSELLHASGLKVVATDISETLISYLKAKHAGVSFEKRRFREIDYKHSFDLVIVLGNSLSLVPEDEITETLPRLRNALSRDGTLVLEFDERDGCLRKDTERRTWAFHGGRWLVLTDRYYDQESRLEKTIDTGLDLQEMSIDQFSATKRLYTLAEIRDHIDSSGLEVVGCFGDYKGTPMNQESQRMVLFIKAAS